MCESGANDDRRIPVTVTVEDLHRAAAAAADLDDADVMKEAWS